MSDRWEEAYELVVENYGYQSAPRNIREEDFMPSQQGPAQQQAPDQGQGQDPSMGDMNQDQGQGQDEAPRAEGEWNEDIKAQSQELVKKSLSDLYASLDAQGQTDFVKNVAGPAIKGQLGVQNVPYKELHGILGGGSADGGQDDQGGAPAPQEGGDFGGAPQM